METKKMSLANIQGKLNRSEMKNIMAGTGGPAPIVYCRNIGEGCGAYQIPCCSGCVCGIDQTCKNV